MSDPRERAIAVLLRDVVPEPPARPGLFDEVVLLAARERRARRLREGTVAASVVALLAGGGLIVSGLSGHGDAVAVPGATTAHAEVSAAPAPTPTAADVPGSSAAANRRIAAALADRLLAGVVLPEGSVAVPDDAVKATTSGYPDATAERRHRVVNVPLSPDETLRRIAAAFPADLGGPWVPKKPVPRKGLNVLSDWTWDEAMRPAIWSATVWVHVVPASGGTLVRVDSDVVWLDPEPRVDPPATPAVRFASTGGCPADLPGRVTVSNVPGAVPDGALLPAGTPTGGLVCGWTKGAAVRRTVLDAEGAAELADAVRAMPLGQPAADVVTRCPAAPPQVVLVALSFPDRPEALVAFWPDGCGQSTRNGRIQAYGLPDAVDVTRWLPQGTA